MLGQSIYKKTNQPVTFKRQNLFVGQVDISNLANPNKTRSIASPKSSLQSPTYLQNNTSPTSKVLSIVSARNLSQNNKKTTFGPSAPPAKTSRPISIQFSNEQFKENISSKTTTSKVEWGTQISLSSPKPLIGTTLPEPSPRHPLETRKRIRNNAGSMGDIELQLQQPKLEIMDIALSPQMKKKIQGPKQEKVFKLLESYVTPSSRPKKTPTHTHSIAFVNNLIPETIEEIQEIPAPRARRLSDAPKPQEIPWESISKPVTPRCVLEFYYSYLSPFEREEIKDYTDIYYIGDRKRKIQGEKEADYDNEKGDYIINPGDHVKYRYEIVEILGKGSFGQVAKAFDHQKKEYIALKIIKSQKKFTVQAKIEIKLLEYITSNHGSDYNITDLRSYFPFRGHTCLIFDLMSLNLYDFLKANKFQGLHLTVIKKIAIQVLYALKFLNHHKIIHCDLKPENILLKQPTRTGVRLIDFGSSCFENEKLYTYIQSRFYRAPEIILGLEYSTQIDMWSFGCLLCELYTGDPLFAGETEQDQLLAMMEIFGVPDVHLIAKSPRRKIFFEDNLKPKLARNSQRKLRMPNTRSLTCILGCEDQNFVDLIKRCLVYDPKRRYTPDEALAHPWILGDLPAELKSEHIQLIERLGGANKPNDEQSTIKRYLLKGREQSCLQTEKTMEEVTNIHDRRDSKNESLNKEILNKEKGKKLETTKSPVGLTINTSQNWGISQNHTLLELNKSDCFKENLLAMLQPHTTKESSKPAFLSNNFSGTNRKQDIYQSKIKRIASMSKNNEKPLYNENVNGYLSPNFSIKAHHDKENNKTKESESSVITAALNENKQSLSYRSWNFSKQNESSTKASSSKTHKGTLSFSINLQSPKSVKLV